MSEQDEARAKLWASLGWQPPDELADEALTHRSFTNELQGPGYAGSKRAAVSPRPSVRNNQRLEFLGDAVLSLCVSELLMKAHPEADEGALSRMRSSLVKADPLAEFGRSIGLGEALRLGRGASAAGDRNQRNVLADAVEALVGAAYLDGGLPQARALVGRVVGGQLGGLDPRGRDPKSELQERVQAQGGVAPSYRTSGTEGPEHDRWFLVEVIVDDEPFAVGRGRTKKLAEQDAARLALEKLLTP